MFDNFTVHRALEFRDRLMRALSYQMRHRNNNGAKEILQIKKFQIEAGGEDQLRILIAEICKGAAECDTVQMHTLDRRRWALWAFDLLT